jgi:hypothetical protein
MLLFKNYQFWGFAPLGGNIPGGAPGPGIKGGAFPNGVNGGAA